MGAGGADASSGVVTVCVCVADAGLVWARDREAMVLGFGSFCELGGLTGGMWCAGSKGDLWGSLSVVGIRIN